LSLLNFQVVNTKPTEELPVAVNPPASLEGVCGVGPQGPVGENAPYLSSESSSSDDDDSEAEINDGVDIGKGDDDSDDSDEELESEGSPAQNGQPGVIGQVNILS
jgi:hypothetical protein